MNYTIIILISSLTILILYNLFISFLLSKSVELSSEQKFYQKIIVWLIPIFGAVFIHFMLKDSVKTHDKPGSFAKRSNSSSGIGEGDGE